MTVFDEFTLIRHLTARTDPTLLPGHGGPGDDCAILAATSLGFSTGKRQLLLTTDSSVAGVHFHFDPTRARDIGWKSLCVSLSDIAAMGGSPHVAVVALHLPPGIDQRFLEDIYDGFAEVSRRYSLSLVGGDTVRSPTLAVTTTVLGSVASDALERRGAQVGDDIWVSGSIGAAFAGLSFVQKHVSELTASEQQVVERHCRPEPRLLLGQLLLQRRLAHSSIDVSDGLLADLGHIAQASGVGLLLDLEEIPFNVDAVQLGFSPLKLATGGEDYELAFTAPPSSRNALEALDGGVVRGEQLPKLTRIGAIAADLAAGEVFLREGDGIVAARKVLEREGLAAPGYQHC
ncbi:MAG: thiamine-phosphate kinase [Bdellovibrionales bacterium]|nr:thiamine-phosphate kinase [Bdellovibrionales bacterium]